MPWRGSAAQARLGVPGYPRPVRVHVTRPDREPLGVALIQHGFARRPQALDGLAEALAQAGFACLRPSVASIGHRGTFNDRRFVSALALAIAEAVDSGRIPGLRGLPAVGIGHSAGAATVVHAHSVLRHRVASGPGFALGGLLLVDGVDSPAGFIRSALPDLAESPALLIAARPGPCNRGGALARALTGVGVGHAGLRGAEFPHGGHGDAERLRGGASPALAYRVACGDRTAPEDLIVLERLIVGWTADLAAPDQAPTANLRPGGPDMDRWIADGRVRLLA